MTRIYGASDDLVEFEGELEDEFGCYDKAVLIVLSDGTVLLVAYGEKGVWKITVQDKGSLFDRLELCDSPEADPYSDVAHFKTGLQWAYAATKFERIGKPIPERKRP